MLKVKFILGDLALKAEVDPVLMESDSIDIDFSIDRPNRPRARIRFEKHNNEWVAQNGMNGFGDNIRSQVIGKKLQIANCDLDLLATCEKMDEEKGLVEETLQKNWKLVSDYNQRWDNAKSASLRSLENLPSDMDFKILELYEHYLKPKQ